MPSHLTPLDWAFQQPDLPETPKFVLVTLAKHADDRDFTCFPSIERIASMCGVRLRAAQYALADLIHSGYVCISGWKEWGAPIYKLAVGQAVRWLGRLRKRPAAPGAPPAQGALVYAPGAPEPMHQVHTGTIHVPELPIEHKEERESAATADSPPVLERISIGNGYSVTTTQFAILKERFGDQFEGVIREVSAYGETRKIDDVYALTLGWKIRQPERRVYAERESEAQAKQRRTREAGWEALEDTLRSLGHDIPYRTDYRGATDISPCADGCPRCAHGKGDYRRREDVALLPVYR